MATLRILSTNLLVDRADVDDLRRVIDETDPDVIATQEMGPVTAKVVRETHEYGHLDPRPDSYGMGIATKRPTDVRRLALEDRSGWVARIADAVEIVNIHLINPVDRLWLEKRRSRRRQVAQVGEYVAGLDIPYVVIGDMNASPGWAEYRLLSSLGADAALTTGTDRPTWGPFTFGAGLLRIDHAFVSGVQPVRTSAVRIRGTDHRALIVDIEFGPSGRTVG